MCMLVQCSLLSWNMIILSYTCYLLCLYIFRSSFYEQLFEHTWFTAFFSDHWIVIFVSMTFSFLIFAVCFLIMIRHVLQSVLWKIIFQRPNPLHSTAWWQYSSSTLSQYFIFHSKTIEPFSFYVHLHPSSCLLFPSGESLFFFSILLNLSHFGDSSCLIHHRTPSLPASHLYYCHLYDRASYFSIINHAISQCPFSIPETILYWNFLIAVRVLSLLNFWLNWWERIAPQAFKQVFLLTANCDYAAEHLH